MRHCKLNFGNILNGILFLISVNSSAQTSNLEYKFKVSVYIPNSTIKNLIDKEISDCFGNTGINYSKMQHNIKFFKYGEKIKMQFATSKKVITDFAIEWDLLNIIGTFYYKGRLVIIEADNDTILILNKFFKKTSTISEVTILLDEYGEPLCGSNYLVEDYKLIHLNQVDSF